jgi:predicted transcriptional regulator
VALVETPETFPTAAEAEAMVAAYGYGMTAVGVAERFGVHESTVRAHAKRRSVKRGPLVPVEVLTQYAAARAAVGAPPL